MFVLRKWPYLLLVALLGLHALLAWSGAKSNSPTFDEAMHLGGGASYWHTGDYLINPESGVFPQKWAAIPLVCQSEINFQPLSKAQQAKLGNWNSTNNFLFQKGHNPDQLLGQGRAMIIILSAALGLALFLASKQLWGLPGAFLSLSLYILCPNICANGALVTADIAVSLGFFLAVWSFWALCQKISFPRILAFGSAVGLLLLSKMSGVFIFYVIFFLLLLRLKSAEPLPVRALRLARMLNGRLKILGALLAAIALAGLLSLSLVWSAYGFRHSMLSDNHTAARAHLDEGWKAMSKDLGTSGRLISLARNLKILPEAYLYGFAYTLNTTKDRPAFMSGACSKTGWLSFFPYCFSTKTPIPTLLLILLALWAAMKRWSPDGLAHDERLARLRGDLYRLAPWIVFVISYCLFAISSHINIGFRHVLPCLPVLYLLCGSTAFLLRAEKTRKGFAALIAILLFWLLCENLSIRPRYLAYFNQLAGGPENGYRQLVDSSLDWGQELRSLSQWLVQNKLQPRGETPVYVSYFGSAPIQAYGLDVFHLPSFFRQDKPEFFELRGGVYCISATMLQMVYCMQLAQWDSKCEAMFQDSSASLKKLVDAAGGPAAFSKALALNPESEESKLCRKWELLRFAKLCATLRNREPDAMIGYSILIYKLSDADAAEALRPWPKQSL